MVPLKAIAVCPMWMSSVAPCPIALKNSVGAWAKLLDRIQCGMNFSIVIFINAIETGFSR
jgi:hypothetical protein